MTKVFTAATVLAAALVWSTSCRLHDTTVPTLGGPSELGLSISVTATPDAITRDGGSQSTILVAARSADGGPIAYLPLRVDMAIRGVQQDLGTLSARNLHTGVDGRATATYTAPPPPPPPGQAVTIVTILVTPVGSNYQTAITRSAEIRLTTPGVILPPAEGPTPRFTTSPSSPAMNTPVFFDASTSCAGSAACASSAGILSFDWNFGDGTKGWGERTTHTFGAPGVYQVTLRVTNNRGLSASIASPVSVESGAPPVAAFVFSPTSPLVDQEVVFNGEASRAAPGRRLVDYSWRWGDGSPPDSGDDAFETTHAFEQAGTYVVVLTVTDDVGQHGTVTQEVQVGSGNPVASFVVSPQPPVSVGTAITFDASASTAAAGAGIVSYTWSFGNGTGSGPNLSPTTTKAYSRDGTFVVTLTVTDSSGRRGTASQAIAVQ
jgi:PKD repeat protein